MKSLSLSPALALLAFAAVACGFPKTGPAPAALTAADVSSATQRFPDTNEAELTQGHDLFVAKCNGCHGYPDVNAVFANEWPEIATRMGKKADLDQKQTQAVMRFVMTSQKHAM